jgi:hypothetical protein
MLSSSGLRPNRTRGLVRHAILSHAGSVPSSFLQCRGAKSHGNTLSLWKVPLPFQADPASSRAMIFAKLLILKALREQPWPGSGHSQI